LLKKDAKQFSEDGTVKGIIKKYSNFVDFPIYIGEEQVNSVTALWHKKAADIPEAEANEFYKFVSNDYTEPLGYFSAAIEGKINFNALLFIPKTAPIDFAQYRDEKSVHLYANKVMIQDDCKTLVPEYLRFVKGVVDTEDLPLNVSREVTQNSPVMVKISKVLTGKILGFLAGWAKNDTEKYTEFYSKFGPLLKTGLSSDFENRDKIMELLRFESSHCAIGSFTSLKEYGERMKDSQKEIYYLSGETRDIIEKNPNLEYFQKNDIEVLFISNPLDIYLMPSVHEYDKKQIKSIDSADIDVLNDAASDIETPENKMDQSLISIFKDVLGEKIQDVVISKRLVDSPATLVSGKDGLDPQMKRMMKMMNKDFVGGKKVMEVNMEHALLKNLSRKYIANANDPVIGNCVQQLYEGAQLIDGTLTSPTDFLRRMTDIMITATE